MQWPALLVELGIRGVVLGLVALAGARLLRRRGAEWQHAVWLAALAGMLVLPVLREVLPPLTVFSSLPAMRLTSQSAGPTHSNPAFLALESPRAVLSSPVVATLPQGTPSRLSLATLALVLYGGVAFALLMRTLVMVARARRLAREARRLQDPGAAMAGFSDVEVRESCVEAPFTVGFFRPVIVLPQGCRRWDRFKLHSVLLHEFAHIRRRDWPIAVAASVNRALFWYNPVSWWVQARLAALAEEACDATAVRSTGDPARYARVVLDFAEAVGRTTVPATTGMATSSSIGRRVNAILDDQGARRRRLSPMAAMLVATFAVVPVLAAASLQVGGSKPAAEVSSAKAAAPRQPRYETERALLAEGWHVTADEASRLEAQLAADPENLPLRYRLVSYYSQYMVPEPRTRHVLWLIENHPEAEIFVSNSVFTTLVADWTGMTTPSNAERARSLWMQQTERFASDPRVLANAATALSVVDARMAIELIKRARQVEPRNVDWTNWLGVIYARAVRASLAGGEGVRSYMNQTADREARPAFNVRLPASDALKAELQPSDDAALIGAAGEALVFETSLLKTYRGGIAPNPEVEASHAFGLRLLARARSLDPANPRWKD